MKPFFGLLRWTLNVFPLFFSLAAAAAPTYDNLVDIRSVDPTILVDLRYAKP